MDNSSYKKIVLPLVAVKEAKAGFRTMLRKKQTLNLSHGILGMADEFGEVRQALAPFILGHQLTDEIRSALAPELGDFLFYLHLTTKEAKVKMPTATKKLLPKHTLTELVVMIDKLVTDNLDQYKQMYLGLQPDMETIQHNLEEIIPLTIQMSWGFLHEPLATLQAGNAAKLQAKFPTGKFEPEVAAKKQAAKKAAKAVAKSAETA